MKTTKLNRLTALLCTLALVLTLTPTILAADTPYVTRNINENRGSNIIYPYLFVNPQGGLTRVDAKPKAETESNEFYGVVVEDYDSNFNLVNSRRFPMELTYFAGFFAGKQYNFIIYGQGNPYQDDNAEVLRVVKYSKDWQRLGQASINSTMGTKIYMPLTSGTLRCAETGNWLYIHTCQTQYKDSGGVHHQSNLTARIDVTTMDASTHSRFYVSHSFDQHIVSDSDGAIIALDLGDGHPRAVVMQKQRLYMDENGNYLADAGKTNILDIPGKIGSNYTGVSIGGLAATKNGYISVYHHGEKGQYSYDGIPNGYLAFTSKDLQTTREIMLPQSTGILGGVVAPKDENGGYIIWNTMNDGENPYNISDTLRYVSYDANGNIGQVKTGTGALSSCVPVYYNGMMVWYVTDNSAPVFYGLNDSGIRRLDGQAASAPTPVSAPSTPAVGGFTDVSASSPYKDAILWAVDKNITNGKTATTFGPNDSCTVSQCVTFLWRAAGRPEPSYADAGPLDRNKAFYWGLNDAGFVDRLDNEDDICTRLWIVRALWVQAGSPEASKSADFTDIKGLQEYDRNAISWAVEKGITTGTSAATFSPSAPCTRGQIVTFLYRNRI